MSAKAMRFERLLSDGRVIITIGLPSPEEEMAAKIKHPCSRCGFQSATTMEPRLADRGWKPGMVMSPEYHAWFQNGATGPLPTSPMYIPCPDCEGSGKAKRHRCSDCGGTGEVIE